ncbi:hypothetical protein PCANB_000186 [Pneumocystis canis]|nr:hypothetical protein PCANB_000186 [Pneumocystis canis]
MIHYGLRRPVIQIFLNLSCTFRSQWIHQSSLHFNDKISKLVNEISALTLRETADLVSQLKIHLNIQDIRPVITSVTAPIPEKNQNEEKQQDEEKRLFNLTLESYDTLAKAKVIKEVKTILGLNLVEAKKFVESSPIVLKEGLGKEDADKIKKMLENLGAKISLS